ncbi:MAG: spore coat protein CotJB [Clostridia bacterium]|nr:spore coat protein CotJB [Clostridia bacterium]
MLKNENANMRGRNSALDEICKISFYIDDLRLYLDTHPGCTEALEMIKEYMGKRKALMSEFTDKYGSIEAYMIGDSDSWKWNAGYMPWNTNEGGC